MGKVVKIAAAVVGVAAIVIPGVGPAITGVLGGLFSGAAIGGGVTAFGLAAGQLTTMALMMHGMACPIADMSPVGSGSVLHLRAGVEIMPPRRSRWHWLRFARLEAMGDCMTPHFPHGMRGLIDRSAIIRRGDLVCMKTADGIIVKRFTEVDGDHVEVATAYPPQSFTVPRDKIIWAYRIRAMAKEKRGLSAARAAIKADPTAHMERLGQVIIREWRDRLAV